MKARSQTGLAHADSEAAGPAGAVLETPKGPPLLSMDSMIFKDVRVPLEAALGQTTMTVEDLLALKAGSVVKLDLKMNDLVELRLNQSVVARGEIVAVDDHFGIRIFEVGKAP
jgi:flagellar motor switch protein FliN